VEATKLRAKEVMKTEVVSTKKSASAKDIASQLVSGRFSGMPVTDAEQRVIGVITEHDLLEQVREGKDLGKLAAEDVMQKNPITVDVDAPLSDVLDIMLENEILRVPVTDGLRLVGIISRSSILRIELDQRSSPPAGSSG
jgi:CIC family chloride channel protein